MNKNIYSQCMLSSFELMKSLPQPVTALAMQLLVYKCFHTQTYTYSIPHKLTGLKVCLCPFLSSLTSPSICSIKLQGAGKMLLITVLFSLSLTTLQTHTHTHLAGGHIDLIPHVH